MTELALGQSARDLALHRAIQKHGPAYLLVVGLARSLAFTAGRDGITVADLREAALKNLNTLPELAKALPEKGRGRELAWLGGVLKAAGLRATDRMRRSHIPGTHGNRNVVYLHPDLTEAR